MFWLMIPEIFPLANRSKAMAVCMIANWAANFIVSYFFLQEIGLIGARAGGRARRRTRLPADGCDWLADLG